MGRDGRRHNDLLAQDEFGGSTRHSSKVQVQFTVARTRAGRSCHCGRREKERRSTTWRSTELGGGRDLLQVAYGRIGEEGEEPLRDRVKKGARTD